MLVELAVRELHDHQNDGEQEYGAEDEAHERGPGVGLVIVRGVIVAHSES